MDKEEKKRTVCLKKAKPNPSTLHNNTPRHNKPLFPEQKAEMASEKKGERVTDWVSVSEPVPFFCSNKCVSLLADIHRPSKPKAREGRQVNEGKSRVKGSEEIPNVNEESIRF